MYLEGYRHSRSIIYSQVWHWHRSTELQQAQGNHVHDEHYQDNCTGKTSSAANVKFL